MWPIVGGNFDGNIEIREYAICIFSGHGFGRESLFSGGLAHNEAGMIAGDEDDFVLPLSSVVFCLGVGIDVGANGREWPRGNRLGADFAVR